MIKYGVTRNGWDVSGLPYKLSSIWRGIISVKALFEAHVRFKIGTGEDVFFWHDVCVGEKPLEEEYATVFRCG